MVQNITFFSDQNSIYLFYSCCFCLPVIYLILVKSVLLMFSECFGINAGIHEILSILYLCYIRIKIIIINFVEEMYVYM